jgi:hypothetical protein
MIVTMLPPMLREWGLRETGISAPRSG